MNEERKANTLLGIGLGGAGVAAICCFTPALALGLTAVGLSSIVGAWMDVILLPGLVLFLCLAVFALLRRNKARAQAAQSRS